MNKEEKQLIKLLELATKLVLLEDKKLFKELGKKWPKQNQKGGIIKNDNYNCTLIFIGFI